MGVFRRVMGLVVGLLGRVRMRPAGARNRQFGQRGRAAACAMILAVAFALLTPMPRALAACNTSGTNQNCTNPAGTTVSGGASGISDTATLTLTNFGTVTGTTYGVFTPFGSANVTNSGTIFGAAQYGIFATNNVTIVNSGTISTSSAGVAGIIAQGNGTITNSGTISGPRGIIAGGGGIFIINNSGSIIGTNGSAIDFSASFAGNTLNFLAGSRIVGDIALGSGDTVNIRSDRDIGWLLTFNS